MRQKSHTVFRPKFIEDGGHIVFEYFFFYKMSQKPGNNYRFYSTVCTE